MPLTLVFGEFDASSQSTSQWEAEEFFGHGWVPDGSAESNRPVSGYDQPVIAGN